MKRIQAIARHTLYKQRLQERFSIIGLVLFVPTVSDVTSADSDVDILVNFDGRANSRCDSSVLRIVFVFLVNVVLGDFIK